MKTRLLFCLLICFGVSIAQQGPSSMSIDPRIRKHYTELEIQEMLTNGPSKIVQLNFYFRNSFVIVGPTTSKEVDLLNFDVMEYEKFRKEDERVIMGLTREGHILELLSRKELKEKYKTL